VLELQRSEEMSRVQATADHVEARRLVCAAEARFDSDGYHGTSIRKIVADAGCSCAAFYDHFPSKQALLLEIIDATLTTAVAQIEAAVALAGEDPLGRLEAAVWAQCDFHIRYRRAWRVAESEWLNLNDADRDRLAVKRVRSVEIISEIIGDGAAGGIFDVDEPAATGVAVSTMCGAIGSWYESGGRYTPRRVTKVYCDLAARMVGADPSRVGRPRSHTVRGRRSA
jgi:AcrR family transcriptional regulator